MAICKPLPLCVSLSLDPLEHIAGTPVACAAADVDVGLGKVQAFGQAVGDLFAAQVKQFDNTRGIQAGCATGHGCLVGSPRGGGVHVDCSCFGSFKRRPYWRVQVFWFCSVCAWAGVTGSPALAAVRP